MSFPTFNESHKEPILCWLYGMATGGKSTLALDFIRENQPGVIIPMDQRFDIYRDLALQEGVKVFPVSDPKDPTVWAKADLILESLRKNFPGSGAKALVWDSISPEFREHVEWAMGYADKSPEERVKALGPKFKNKAALYQPKAHYMEQLAIIANYGVACLWISHEHEGRDQTGQEAMKTSISAQERRKFRKNTNLFLKMVIDGNRYGVEIEEARNRPELDGKVFWDAPGNMFKGTWKRIAEAFYNSPIVDMSWSSYGINKPFPTPDKAVEMALEFSVESGGEQFYAFGDPDEAGAMAHAANSYKKLKEGGYEEYRKPTKPGEMAESWKALVERKAWAAVKEAAKPKEMEIDEPPQTAMFNDDAQFAAAAEAQPGFDFAEEFNTTDPNGHHEGEVYETQEELF